MRSLCLLWGELNGIEVTIERGGFASKSGWETGGGLAPCPTRGYEIQVQWRSRSEDTVGVRV